MNALANPGTPPAKASEIAGRYETVAVATGIYPPEVILRAAHRFSGAFYVEVGDGGPGIAHVRFRPKSPASAPSVGDDFRNELLDESLRAIVAEESKAERDLILAHALSRHAVLHAEFERAEAFSDPANLLSPDPR